MNSASSADCDFRDGTRPMPIGSQRAIAGSSSGTIGTRERPGGDRRLLTGAERPPWLRLSRPSRQGARFGRRRVAIVGGGEQVQADRGPARARFQASRLWTTCNHLRAAVLWRHADVEGFIRKRWPMG